MADAELSRRNLLLHSSRALGLTSLAHYWPAILAAQEHAHQTPEQGSAPPRLQFFSAEQAEEVEAIAAQIIPTDDMPGAREARVIYFIDRALATVDNDKQHAYLTGLDQLRTKTHELFRGTDRLSELTPDQQTTVLKTIEHADFFDLVRTHTIIGFFANPEYGGNFNRAGWKLIGFEDAFSFHPPFGYYDAGA